MSNFRSWVPDKAQTLIYLLILLIFQVCNGFYFAAMAQIAGEWSLTSNQVHFLGEVVLCGLAFYFPWAFRLKFRFTNQAGLLISSLGLAAVNFIFPYITFYPALVVLCYIGGFLHLYGTFECLSNLLPKVAPTFNYAVFLSFVFFTVLGMLQLIDWTEIRIIYHYDWQHLHYFSIGLCLLVTLVACTLMVPFREMPKMKLYGVDPLGMFLWSLFILSTIYIFQFGEQYNWLSDFHIRIALGITLLSLAFALERMFRIRHPFIEPEAFKSPNLLYMWVIFLALDILISSQTVLQNAFTSTILGYDMLTNSRLLIPRFFGAAAAALFCWQTRVKLKFKLKTLTFISMAAMVLYDVTMLGCLSPAVNIEKLYLPAFFLGFGHVGIFIAVTVYAQSHCNFRYYFQVICLLGWVRMGIGEPLGCALWGHALQGSMNHYLGLAQASADLSSVPYAALVAEAMMSSLRRLYGWAVVFGVCMLILILAGHFDRLRHPLPKLKQIYLIVSKNVGSKMKILLGLMLFSAAFTATFTARAEAQAPSTLPTRTYTLTQLFDSVEAHNTGLKVFSSAVEMADENLKDAKFQYLPDIDASLSVSYIGDCWAGGRDFSNGALYPMSSLPGKVPHLGNNFSLKVSQVIYAGGAISNRVKLGEMGRQMAAFDMEKNRQDVRFRVTGTYLDLYKTLNTLQVLEKNIALAGEVLDDMKSRYEQGVALQNDITRYELQLQNLLLEKDKAEDRYRIYNHQLCLLTGLEDGVLIFPDTTLLQNTLIVPDEEDSWQTRAQEGNYMLKQADLSVRMAEREVALNKAGTRPGIFFFAEDDFLGPFTSDVAVDNRNFNFWYVGLGVQYKIGDTYKSMHRIRAAKQKQTQAGFARDHAAEQVDMEVQAAHTRLLTSFSEVQTQEKQVVLAEQNYDVVNHRYENGLSLITDMLDASNILLSADLRLINARIDLLYNYYHLLYLSHQL